MIPKILKQVQDNNYKKQGRKILRPYKMLFNFQTLQPPAANN
jgi:hypothetical protein